MELAELINELLALLRSKVSIVNGRVKFIEETHEDLLDELKKATINAFISSESLREAREWIKVLQESLNKAGRSVGALGWTISKELKSFINDPQAHLKKKLFLYSFDLLRNRITVNEYLEKSRAALTTSLKTNMRSIYQTWVFAAILNCMGRLEGRLVYPEHGYIPLERSGKQKAGSIPPNAIIKIPGRGEVSFFIEAPRPIGWEDTRDLKSVWKLYISLRPDIMVYSGRVLNIVKLDSQDAPILRPNMIIECKELSDWFNKVRELKGPVAKPLTAEEWMSKWIDGLWTGLADALGVGERAFNEFIEGERRGLRITEPRLIALYKQVYKPDRFTLVSLPRIPEYLKKDLESWGVNVIDGVSIGCDSCLKELVEEVVALAKYSGSMDVIEELRSLLKSRGVEVSRAKLEEALLSLAIDKIDDLVSMIAQ
ncbi:MAG: hypothetical protein QW369_02035 [Desulfurococcaceae archaeon]